MRLKPDTLGFIKGRIPDVWSVGDLLNLANSPHMPANIGSALRKTLREFLKSNSSYSLLNPQSVGTIRDGVRTELGPNDVAEFMFELLEVNCQ